jgi:hypothetical protein
LALYILAISRFGSFVPLLKKNFSATTEKNHGSRVKQKLENEVLFFWRQEVDEWAGDC